MVSKVRVSYTSLMATTPPFLANFSGMGGSGVIKTDSAPVFTMNKCSQLGSFNSYSVNFLLSSPSKDFSNLSAWILFFIPNIQATLSLKYCIVVAG
jgi:hypothetical protein